MKAWKISAMANLAIPRLAGSFALNRTAMAGGIVGPVAWRGGVGGRPRAESIHMSAIRRSPADGSEPFEFDNIFKKNKEWVNSKRSQDPEFFKRLATSQHPHILWIGCSDARVPANQICGLDSGTMFVQRNIANMVVGTDTNAMSVIQYAVDFLQVPHIVVCGHYDCGGVRAALRNMNHGSPLENWLRNIRDVWRLHRDELKAIPVGEDRVRRLVELNVAEQCLNVYKSAPVQKRRWDSKLKGGKAFPIIHGVVYDPANGILNRVPIDIHQKVGELRECYDLYDFESGDLNESFS